MLNYFLKILKNKKILFFVFLSIVIFCFGFFSTSIQKVHAVSGGDPSQYDACERGCHTNYTGDELDDCISACMWELGHQTDSFTKILGEELAREYGKMAEVMAVPFATFVFAIGAVIISIGGSLSVLASTILVTVLGMLDSVGCYTCMTNTAVAAGWPMVRDLANMFVVLGFVVIGLATILRFREYEAKKLLPKLIIVALLINFSLPICGIFIDASNITAKYFLKSGGFFANSWGQTLDGQLKILFNAWKIDDYIKASIQLLGSIGGITFYNIMAMVIFLLYAFLYIFRIIALWILVILSPLAFVFYVFPFTKKFFDMWWSNFLGWCIIIVPISFFVWIADKIMAGIVLTSTTPGEPPSFFSYLIPGSFMIIGFLFSIRMSAMGASAAVGAAKWTGGKITGATGGTLKGLANTRAGQKISRGAVLAGEKMGLVAPGTTNLMKQKHMKEHESEKRVSTLPDDQVMKGGFTGRTPISKRGRNDKFEFIKQSVESGKAGEWLNKGEITQDQYDKGVAYYKSHGGPIGALAEKDYRVAGHGAANPTIAQTKKNVQFSENLSKGMSGKQLRGISADDMDRALNPDMHDIIKEQFTPNTAKQFKTSDPTLKTALRTHLGAVGTAGTLANDIHIATDPKEKAKLQKVYDALDKATI